MKSDYYVDSIMGDWKHDKKQSNKDNLVYTRRVEVKLHRDNAVVHTDPKDMKKYRVYGDVVLTEKKMVSVKTSLPTLFRGVELTETSNKDEVI